jgi:hypothetical protein
VNLSIFVAYQPRVKESLKAKLTLSLCSLWKSYKAMQEHNRYFALAKWPFKYIDQQKHSFAWNTHSQQKSVAIMIRVYCADQSSFTDLLRCWWKQLGAKITNRKTVLAWWNVTLLHVELDCKPSTWHFCLFSFVLGLVNTGGGWLPVV